MTGAAILYLALKKLGANVCVRLPDRIFEGYGISMYAIQEEIALGAKLFVTIDNGVKANKEIDEIRKRAVCPSCLIIINRRCFTECRCSYRPLGRG